MSDHKDNIDVPYESIGDKKTFARLWENNTVDVKDNAQTAKTNGSDRENIIEKEVLLARERERQLRLEREARSKELASKTNVTEVATDTENKTNNNEESQVKATAHRNSDDTTSTKHIPALTDNQSHKKTDSDSRHSQSQERVTDTTDGGEQRDARHVTVTYEEIISEPTHKGEGLVFEEIQNHKAREEELKLTYINRGIQLNNNYQSSTVITIASPSNSNKTPAAVNQDVNSELSPRSAKHETVSSQDISSSISDVPKNSNKDNSDISINIKGDQIPLHDKTWQMDNESYRYIPRVETPIEREIRLNKEREIELRSRYEHVLSRRESTEHITTASSVSSIRRQRNEKTDVNVKEKRRTFELENAAKSDEKQANSADVTSTTWNRRRSSEFIIEQEMREMRAREEELRLTRLNSSTTE